MKTILISLAAIITSGALHSSSYFRDLDYNDVRKEGGFSSEKMANVCYIESSGTKLTDEEKKALLTSNHLHHLHTLDLSGQDLNDDFIEQLSRNQSLSRLITLDLSNNPSITDTALDHILNSTVLGSVRDLQQVSARYGGPSTTVRVKCKNTNIKKTAIDPVFYFTVNYIHPVTGKILSEPTDQGIKFIILE